MIQKTVKQVRERYKRLLCNLDLIKNKKGRENVMVTINVLKSFLDNSNMNLRYEIDNLPDGQRRQTLKWINGGVI